VETTFGAVIARVPGAARLILYAWAAAGVALLGLGALVRTLLGRRPTSADDWLGGIWLGWAAAIGVLQVWQLFFRVDHRIAGILTILAVLGMIGAGRGLWAILGRGILRHAVAILIFGLLTVWLSLYALGGPRNGDSGLYHVPTIVWHLAERLPPGLGNLAAPFAYNQSFFLWEALLDVAPLPGRGTHVTNMLFVVALMARVLLALSRLVRRRECSAVDAFYALMLPAVLPLAHDINVTSPSPDIAVFTLGIVIAGETLAFFERGRRFADLAAVALLVAIAPPIKLSLAGLAAATGLVAGVAWLRRAEGRDASWTRAVAVLGTIALLAPGAWMLRGVVLSGYPLYPSAIFGAPVDWAVPYETVIAEAKLIRYWNGVEGWWRLIWQDPMWLVRWLPTLDWLRPDVLTPLGIAALAGLVGLGRAALQRKTPRAVPAAIVLPTLGSIAFCIAAAPRARYPASAYWVLAAQTTWLALSATALASDHAWLRRLLAAVAVGLALFFGRSDGPLLPEHRDFEPHVTAVVHQRRLPSGLVVNDPGATMQCWDAPVPCSPFKEERLRLRRDGALASGFTVRPPR
jgi:hypothetical protein